jgi:hypothetical protein
MCATKRVTQLMVAGSIRSSSRRSCRQAWLTAAPCACVVLLNCISGGGLLLLCGCALQGQQLRCRASCSHCSSMMNAAHVQCKWLSNPQFILTPEAAGERSFRRSVHATLKVLHCAGGQRVTLDALHAAVRSTCQCCITCIPLYLHSLSRISALCMHVLHVANCARLTQRVGCTGHRDAQAVCWHKRALCRMQCDQRRT